MDLEIFKKRSIFYNILKFHSNHYQNDEFINEWEFDEFVLADYNKFCICGQRIKNVFII